LVKYCKTRWATALRCIRSVIDACDCILHVSIEVSKKSEEVEQSFRLLGEKAFIAHATAIVDTLSSVSQPGVLQSPECYKCILGLTGVLHWTDVLHTVPTRL
jgi:hypothetical protein